MRLLISLSALLISIFFTQLGSGSLGPLDALSGAAKGFSLQDIGYLGSAHFAGFLVGCLVSAKMIMRVGHARAFVAMATIAILSALLHPMWFNAIFWMVLRFGTGFAVAGAYTVIESWLQAKLENSNRARVFSVYRLVDISGTLVAQGMIAGLEPASYAAYNTVAIACCFCLLPLALTQSAPPALPEKLKVRPLMAFILSPLGAAGVMVAGLTNSSFRMIGPIFADRLGFAQDAIALFLALGILGGGIAQFPIAWLADSFDRRRVLMALSLFALAVCFALTSDFGLSSAFNVFVLIFLFGAATIPIYSISVSHAHDFSTPVQSVELSASLIFIYALGAIISPALTGWLMAGYGPNAMFAFIAVAHFGLLVFGLWRTTRRPTHETRAPYRYLPRTSLFVGQFLRRKRQNGKSS